MKKVKKKVVKCIAPTEYRTIVLQVTNPSHYQLSYRSLLTIRKISKDYGQILVDNKILVSILTHRCQCPHGIPKTGGVRGGATHIHMRELPSEPHVKKGYKLRNHHFYNPAIYRIIYFTLKRKMLFHGLRLFSWPIPFKTREFIPIMNLKCILHACAGKTVQHHTKILLG